MANEFKIKKGLIVTGASGGIVVDVQGSQGQLFSVTDDLSGSIFAVSDISGVPILDVNSSGLSTFDGDVNLPDNKKILLGTGNDLEIYHDGSNSYIRDQGTGNLIITGSQLTFSNEADTEYMVKMVQNGTVELYYDGSKKLQTTSAGVVVTGAVTITDTAGTRGINRNNTGYNLDLMGGTNNTDGAYISLSGQTRGGAANSYNGRIELYSGGSGLAARADALGDLIFGTKWNGGAAQILILDSASGDAAFSNNVTASAVTATTFSGDLNGTINTVTTAVTKPNTTDDNTVATTAFVKNLIAELPAGLIYKGTWNADTNTPTLAAGGGEISEGTTTTVTADKLIDSAATFTTDGVAVGDRVRVENVNGVSYALVTSVDSQTQLTLDADIVVSTTEVYIIETPAFLEEGNYYIVSVDGATDLNGITDWKVGDWVVASSTNEWQKIDNSSVLDGQGTGQTIPLWSGSGDSNTLGNAPITVSGNNTTFAGTGNFGGSVNIASGGDLILTASSGSTDTGDIVFYHTAAEAHRLWSGTNTLNYRTDGGTTYYMLHSGNYTDYNTYTTLTATTQSAGDDTTNVATTEFVTDAVATGVGNYLPLSAGASYPLTDTLYVRENGNKNNGTISMGFGGSGTSKWSFLTGTHYNQATGSGNGTGSAGMAIIGSLSTETYNKVYIGGGPYEINAATQIDFWTHSGTLSTQGGTRRGYVDNGGNWFLGDTLWVDAADDYVGIGTTTPGAKLDVQPTASNRKVTRIANDVMSTYFYNTQADAVLAWTCGSYYQAEVVITASQTNGGDYNNIYIRGIWSNNHTSHHWDELERVGFLTGSTFTMSVGQNGTTTNSGRLELDFNYVSASFAQLNVRVTDFYGTHSYTIT